MSGGHVVEQRALPTDDVEYQYFALTDNYIHGCSYDLYCFNGVMYLHFIATPSQKYKLL